MAALALIVYACIPAFFIVGMFLFYYGMAYNSNGHFEIGMLLCIASYILAQFVLSKYAR